VSPRTCGELSRDGSTSSLLPPSAGLSKKEGITESSSWLGLSCSAFPADSICCSIRAFSSGVSTSSNAPRSEPFSPSDLAEEFFLLVPSMRTCLCSPLLLVKERYENPASLPLETSGSPSFSFRGGTRYLLATWKS